MDKSCRNCIHFYPGGPFGDGCGWRTSMRVIDPDSVCHNWSEDDTKDRPATMPEIETKDGNLETTGE